MERKFISAHGTTWDGKRVTLSEDEANKLWERVQSEKAAREELMPDFDAAMQSFGRTHERLRELGWKDGMYCPKDGSDFAVIQFGPTGCWRASYSGKWPDGYILFSGCVRKPDGLMWKPLDKLTEAELSRMQRCDEQARMMLESELASFAAIDVTPSEPKGRG